MSPWAGPRTPNGWSALRAAVVKMSWGLPCEHVGHSHKSGCRSKSYKLRPAKLLRMMIEDE